MHEIGVVREVVKTVLRYAEEHNVKEVSEIVVDIGELSLIVPKHVEDPIPPVAGTSRGHQAYNQHHPGTGHLQRL